MKKILYILLLSTQVFFAQNGFEKGNALYEKGKYAEAVGAYESVLGANLQSPELYFNLGNAYYKWNKVAPAIYYYEKALVLNPKDNESLNNLKFAHKRTIDEIKVIPKVGFEKLMRDFTGIYNYNTWGWITIGFATLFLLFFIGYYFSENAVYKRIFFFGMFVALVLLLLAVSSAIFEKSHFGAFKISDRKPAGIAAPMVMHIASMQANLALRYLANLCVKKDLLYYLFINNEGELIVQKLGMPHEI